VDPIVMRAVVSELGAALTGSRVSDVIQIEASRFLIRFGDPPFPRVHIAIHPRLSTLHLARGIRAPATTTELAVELTRELAGRAVLSVSKPADERLVRIHLDEGRTLIVELMGKASNLLLLDGQDRILRFARTHHGEFRQPVVGGLYQPPPPVAGFPDPWPGMSPLLARERDPATLLDRAAGGRYDAVLYSPAPPLELPESLALTSRNLFAFPFPLSHATGLTATSFASVNEAEEAATGCLLRNMLYETVHQSLAALLRREGRRTTDLISVLEEELAEAERSGHEDRRRGELILAGLHAARKEGDVVRVVDHYDPEERIVEIPIDPRLDLKGNAQRYFKSARRGARARELLPARLERLRARLEAVGDSAERVEQARTRVELEAVERELQDAGIVRAFRKAERAEVGRKAEYVKVKEFLTREGFTVLVGRTASENDHLTFKVAAPHDLWLHAAGHAGAHVIVRNPRRLPSLPDATVLEAAAIAAYFSKGGGTGDMDVHVTFRRHVRKGRGMSPGMVMLKRHRTVRVSPALPSAQGRGVPRMD
jgi:predicted ribosome quality control (RQC) complex YloA/Tae2 family protein